MTDAPVAIVGGGLSGLAVASGLAQAGRSFQLFEARSRYGGRIDGLPAGTATVDLGPSWFWPGQFRFEGLLAALGLRSFPQYQRGDGCFEDALGRIERGPGIASMAGACRVVGGIPAVVNALVERLPGSSLRLDATVIRVGDDRTVTLADGTVERAGQVVLALPPRLIAAPGFAPMLPDAVRRELEAIPTWMAAHAKLVAVYRSPFWRSAGLSGDAMSRRGPLAEIHDASGPDGCPTALFGFVGLSAGQRQGREQAIRDAACEQLARLFGPEALRPEAVVLKDWSSERETATAADARPLQGHPRYGLPVAAVRALPDWLHVAGSESEAGQGGLMEGALAAAERVLQRLV